jgi:hypothetical protein
MSSPLGTLVWKEWREWRWLLGLATAWIVAGVLYVVAYEAVHGFRAPVARYHITCMLYGLVAAVFLSMRASLGEQTLGTLSFSSALPVSLRTVAAVRLGGAMFVLAGPMILGALLRSVVLFAGGLEQAAQRSLSPPYVGLPERPSQSGVEALGFLWRATAVVIAQSMLLLLILAVIGARRRVQAHVGFIGAVLAMPSIMASALLLQFRDQPWGAWVGAILPQALALNGGYGDARGFFGVFC